MDDEEESVDAFFGGDGNGNGNGEDGNGNKEDDMKEDEITSKLKKWLPPAQWVAQELARLDKELDADPSLAVAAPSLLKTRFDHAKNNLEHTKQGLLQRDMDTNFIDKYMEEMDEMMHEALFDLETAPGGDEGGDDAADEDMKDKNLKRSRDNNDDKDRFNFGDDE